jgi:small conductance mechanosensitive channel
VGTPLVIALTIVIALVLRYLWVYFVKASLRRMERLSSEHERASERGVSAAIGEILPAERRRQRAKAVATLLSSVGTGIIVVAALLIILTRLGVDIAPLLAGAGIVGIALGFGAQSLVKDFISGVFMVLEDQFGVGDVVDTGTVVGEVEDVGLRITRIRDLQGVVWYVRNGEIVNLGNRSQGWAFVAVDIPVGYDQDLARVRDVIERVGGEMYDDPEWHTRLLDRPSMVGVESVSGEAVVVRVTTRAAAQQQLPVSRALRERLKAAFDAEGITVPSVPRY